MQEDFLPPKEDFLPPKEDFLPPKPRTNQLLRASSKRKHLQLQY